MSKSGDLQISAVVCTYSRASLLRFTLDSLIKQTLSTGDYEIVVVDNNSPDNTSDVVRYFQERNSHRIRYVLETRQGLGPARNAGVQHSVGRIISFIDDDAEASPGWLAAVVEGFRQNPDAWAVGGNTFAIWDADRPAWLNDDFLPDLSIQDRGPKTLKLTRNQHPLGANCSFRKEVFAEIGYFPTDLGRTGKRLLAGEEAELCRRIHMRNKSMYHVPDAVVFHHVTPDRMTRKYFNTRCYFSGLSRAFYVSRTYGISFAGHELRGQWRMLVGKIFSEGRRCLTLKKPRSTLFRYWTWFLVAFGYTRGLWHVRAHKLAQISCRLQFRRRPRATNSRSLHLRDATVEEWQRAPLKGDPFVQELRRRLGDTPRAETLCVLGNGPSLKDIDLANLNGVDTVGLNAAYRHWDRTGWYPTYYCCLDTAVVESHHAAIRKLVEEKEQNGIRLFLLQKNILKRQPQLAKHPAVLIYDDWLKSAVFNGCSHVTTGAYAALFGMALGYRRLHLLGVDCRYVEQIAEARPLEGDILEVVSDPVHNPNYFFDDYQRKGDRFHVPNSVPDLHLASWVDCAKTAARLGVTITNGSPDSALRLFPSASMGDISLSSPSVDRWRNEEAASDVMPPTGRKAPTNASPSPPANGPTKEEPARELTLRIGKEAPGEGWSDPVEQNGAPFRWLRTGAKVEIRVNVLRQAPLLLVLTSPRSLRSLEAARLHLEADGNSLDVRVHAETSPNVISSVLPAAPGKGLGEDTALVLRLDPSEEGQSGRAGPNSVAIDRVSLMRPVRGRENDFPLSHFDGKLYLHRYPDVALAVSEGKPPSALEHYKRFGQKEGRPLPLALGTQPSAGTALERAVTDLSSQFRTELVAARKASDDRHDQHIRALEEGIAEQTKALTDRLESLGNQVREIDQWKDAFEKRLRADLNQSLSKVEETISSRLTRIEQQLPWTFAELEARFETGQEQLRGNLLAELNGLREALAAHLSDIDEWKTSFDNRLREALATHASARSARAATHLKQLETHIEELGKRLTAEFREGNQRTSTSLGQQVHAIEAAIHKERSERILDFARRDSAGVPPRNVLLVVAVQRSGSTWLMDSLRCHPGIYVEPTALVFEALDLKGGRYPVGLSDRKNGHLAVELNAERGRGAKIPDFSLRELKYKIPQVVTNRPFAIEKVHPEFFAFNADSFLNMLEKYTNRFEAEVKLIYQFREPGAVLVSFLNYQKRDPTWYPHIGIEQLFELLEKSYSSLLEMIRGRQGLVIDYEDLSSVYEPVLTSIFNSVWGSSSFSPKIAKAAKKRVARRERVSQDQTPFFGEKPGELLPIQDEYADLIASHEAEFGNLKDLYEELKRFRET